MSVGSDGSILDIFSNASYIAELQDKLDVNKYFAARYLSGAGGAVTTYGDNASKYFGNSIGNTLKMPANSRTVALYTRRTFSFPVLSAKAQLITYPTADDAMTRDFYMGFENGGSIGGGQISMVHERNTTPTYHFYTQVSSNFGGTIAQVDHFGLGVLNNPTAGSNNYFIKVYKQGCLFFQNTTLLHAVMFTDGFSYNIGTSNVVKPYSVSALPMILADRLNGLIEFNIPTGGQQNSVQYDSGVATDNFRFADSSDSKIIALPMYQAGTVTKLQASTIANTANQDSNVLPVGLGRKAVIRVVVDGVVTPSIKSIGGAGNPIAEANLTPTVANVPTYITIPDGVIVCQVNFANASGATRTITECDLIIYPT